MESIINFNNSENWIKKCKRCNNIVHYMNKNSFCANRKKSSICKLCKYLLHSEKMKGRKREKFSETWKKNISTGHKNSEIWKKSMNTPEYKEKQRISKLGEKNYFFGKSHSNETKELIRKKSLKQMSIKENIDKLKNRKWTETQIKKHKEAINKPERLKLLRKYRLEQLRKSGKYPSYNNKSCDFFNYINNKLNWSGSYAINGGEKSLEGYSIDYYEPNLNLIIEWDEEYHYKNYGKLLEKDITRQNNLLKTNCLFYRIREKTKKVYKTDNISSDYTILIQHALNEYYERPKSN